MTGGFTGIIGTGKTNVENSETNYKNNRIDILHQLNMIGFREPGYLWKIKEVPFVWGPIGGMELMPMEYLLGVPMKQRLFNYLKNIINQYQYLYSSRVHAAIQKRIY